MIGDLILAAPAVAGAALAGWLIRREHRRTESQAEAVERQRTQEWLRELKAREEDL